LCLFCLHHLQQQDALSLACGTLLALGCAGGHIPEQQQDDSTALADLGLCRGLTFSENPPRAEELADLHDRPEEPSWLSSSTFLSLAHPLDEG